LTWGNGGKRVWRIWVFFWWIDGKNPEETWTHVPTTLITILNGDGVSGWLGCRRLFWRSALNSPRTILLQTATTWLCSKAICWISGPLAAGVTTLERITLDHHGETLHDQDIGLSVRATAQLIAGIAGTTGVVLLSQFTAVR